MSTTTAISSTGNAVFDRLNGSATASTTSAIESQQDRFLKLLVAQLNNQDPMNPLDNAQTTSQMAQINTVTGIEKLNESVKAMAAQFQAMQLMQGSGLVGRQVLVDGNALSLNADGVAKGALELAGASEATRVEILSATGQVVDTVNLGQRAAGQHAFEWPAGTKANQGPFSFRIVAANATQAVPANALTQVPVQGISAANGGLNLHLANGQTTAYSSVKALF